MKFTAAVKKDIKMSSVAQYYSDFLFVWCASLWILRRIPLLLYFQLSSADIWGIMFTKQSLVTLLGGLSLAVAQTTTEEYPSLAEIRAAQATVQPYSPVSNVKGLAFNRFVNIWLENTVCPQLLHLVYAVIEPQLTCHF